MCFQPLLTLLHILTLRRNTLLVETQSFQSGVVNQSSLLIHDSFIAPRFLRFPHLAQFYLTLHICRINLHKFVGFVLLTLRFLYVAQEGEGLGMSFEEFFAD